MKHQRPTYKTPGPPLAGHSLSSMLRGPNQAPTSLASPPPTSLPTAPKMPWAKPHREMKPIIESMAPADKPKDKPKLKKGPKRPVDLEEKADPVLVVPSNPEADKSDGSSDEDDDDEEYKSMPDSDEEEVAEKEGNESSSDDEDGDDKSVQSTKKNKKTWASLLSAGAASVVNSGAQVALKVIKAATARPEYNDKEFHMFGELFTKNAMDNVELQSAGLVLKQNMDYLVRIEVLMKGNTMCYVYRKQWTKWFVDEFNKKFKGAYSITIEQLNMFYDNLTRNLIKSEYSMISYHINGDDFENQKYLYFIFGWGKIPTDYATYNDFQQFHQSLIFYSEYIITNEEGYEETNHKKGYKEINLPSPGPNILIASSYKTEFKALAERISLIVRVFNEHKDADALFEIPKKEILDETTFIRLQRILQDQNWSVNDVV